jgi:uncharacterized phage protein (TIGR02220 family)
VFGLLRKLTGKDFRTRQPNGSRTAGAKLLADRFRDGYTEEDARWVVGTRSAAWKNDDKMRDFLTPATLFRKSNFEKYLATARSAEDGQH